MQSRQELQLIGGISAGLLLAGALPLLFFDLGVSSARWFFIACPLWIYCWLQTWRRLHLNRLDMATPCYDDFGAANRLTLLRGGLIALAGGFLFQSPAGSAAWVPGLLYGIAAMLDRADGWVARRSGRTTVLGRELDTEMDALGLLVAPLLAVSLGKFHWSFLAVSAAYYVFIAGLHWRRRRQLPVLPLPPSTLRRTLAGFQMVFVALVLLPIFPAEATRLFGVAFMIPILTGFFFDWLAVSARLNSYGAEVVYARIGNIGHQFLIPALRACVGLAVVAEIYFSTAHAGVQAIVFLFGVLIVIGAGARTAAGALLIFGCLIWPTIFTGNLVLLFACSWITLLGGGAFCLWRGDDAWVARQN